MRGVRLMKESFSSVKNSVIAILIFVVIYLLFKNYLVIRDRDTEWITASGEIGEISFVEFRPNVTELHNLLLNGDITLVEAAHLRLNKVVSVYPYVLQNCKVTSVQGDFRSLIVQYNCLKLNKVAAVDK